MEYQMVTWPITSRDPKRCCEAVRSASDSLAFCYIFVPKFQVTLTVELYTSNLLP